MFQISTKNKPAPSSTLISQGIGEDLFTLVTAVIEEVYNRIDDPWERAFCCMGLVLARSMRQETLISEDLIQQIEVHYLEAVAYCHPDHPKNFIYPYCRGNPVEEENRFIWDVADGYKDLYPDFLKLIEKYFPERTPQQAQMKEKLLSNGREWIDRPLKLLDGK